MINTINITAIPHKKQRYPTVGDWIYYDNLKHLNIYVSSTPDWREAIAVAVHELAEAVLCIDRGISQKSVDEFDMKFEEDHKPGEPGDDPKAPYYDEHQVATIIERILARELHLNWNSYDRHLADLGIEWGE